MMLSTGHVILCKSTANGLGNNMVSAAGGLALAPLLHFLEGDLGASFLTRDYLELFRRLLGVEWQLVPEPIGSKSDFDQPNSLSPATRQSDQHEGNTLLVEGVLGAQPRRVQEAVKHR